MLLMTEIVCSFRYDAEASTQQAKDCRSLSSVAYRNEQCCFLLYKQLLLMTTNFFVIFFYWKLSFQSCLEMTLFDYIIFFKNWINEIKSFLNANGTSRLLYFCLVSAVISKSNCFILSNSFLSKSLVINTILPDLSITILRVTPEFLLV